MWRRRPWQTVIRWVMKWQHWSVTEIEIQVTFVHWFVFSCSSKLRTQIPPSFPTTQSTITFIAVMFGCGLCSSPRRASPLQQIQTHKIIIRTKAVVTHILWLARFDRGLLGTGRRGSGGIALLHGDGVNVLGGFLFAEGDPVVEERKWNDKSLCQ